MYHLIRTSFIFAADIDECTASPPACHLDTQCTNPIGSYRCTCNLGYNDNEKTCSGTWIWQNNAFSKHKIEARFKMNLKVINFGFTPLSLSKITYYSHVVVQKDEETK